MILGWLKARKWDNVRVNGLDDRRGGWEEQVFEFRRGRDPIACSNNHNGSVEVIERELLDSSRHRIDETPAFARV